MDIDFSNNKSNVKQPREIISNMINELNMLDIKYEEELKKIRSKYHIEKQRIISYNSKKYENNDKKINNNKYNKYNKYDKYWQ